MGYLRYCKIKIKNFKKKLKKSVDKEAKQPYNKTRSAEGTENLREIESKEETQKEQRTLKIKQRTRNPKMTLS